MKKIYLAGSLFNHAEQDRRKKEGAILRQTIGDKYEIFNPIEAPCNDKSKKPTSLDIFIGDTTEVVASDVIVADCSNEDPGVMMELGIAMGLEKARKMFIESLWQVQRNIAAIPELNLETQEEVKAYSKGFMDSIEMITDAASDLGMLQKREIYATLSDLRIPSSGDYDSYHIPFGHNQYMIGGLEDFGANINLDFEDTVNALVKKRLTPGTNVRIKNGSGAIFTVIDHQFNEGEEEDSVYVVPRGGTWGVDDFSVYVKHLEIV